jgi:hypothetical protein
MALVLAVIGYVAGASSAAAAPPDTWVSGTGVDTGNCPATAPCRSFQYALKRTREHGIIAVQSSGVFAGVDVTKPVTIAAEGVVAILRTPAKCGAVVCVNSAGHVTLRGLVVDPMRNGADGVRLLNVGVFHLQQSIVRQSRFGLLATAPGSPDGKIEVSSSVVTGNDLGIRIVATNESKAVFDRVRVYNNSNGIYFDDSARNGTISASVTDSVVAGNAGYGILAVTTGPGHNGIYPNVSVTLDRAAVLNNGRGIVVNGGAARVRLGNSTVTGNGVALRSLNNGAIPSYGTNKIDGNGSGEAPTLVISHQ